MGNLFSTSKHQQEKTFREILRALLEALGLILLLRSTPQITSELGQEAVLVAYFLTAHLAWIEFGDPLRGILDGIAGLFIH